MGHDKEPDMQILISQLYNENFQPVPVYRSKRIFDIALSGTLLLLCAPVALSAATAIKIEGLLDRKKKGPVFFSQERYGRYGEPFTFYKFRMMIDGAEDMLDQVIEEADGTHNWLKIKNDPRVTRVGRFLRDHHLDEIPQLINVLLGDMSLVGPRPQYKRREMMYLENGFTDRYKCIPGVTGPYQTCDRSNMEIGDVDRMDSDYAKALEKGYSVWLDAVYILKTFPSVLLKRSPRYSE